MTARKLATCQLQDAKLCAHLLDLSWLLPEARGQGGLCLVVICS